MGVNSVIIRNLRRRIGRVNAKGQVTPPSYSADGDFEGRRWRAASSRDAYQIGE